MRESVRLVHILIILLLFLRLFPPYSYSAITGTQKEYDTTFEEMVKAIPEAELRSVYRRLENAGFDPGNYEKHDFEQLAAGLGEFQKFAKLPVTGRFDAKTWKLFTQFPDPQGIRIPNTLATFQQSTPGPQPGQPYQQASLTIQWPPVGIVKLLQEALKTFGK